MRCSHAKSKIIVYNYIKGLLYFTGLISLVLRKMTHSYIFTNSTQMFDLEQGLLIQVGQSQDSGERAIT